MNHRPERRMRRSASVVTAAIAAGALALGLSGCAEGSGEPETIKIGVSNALTGDLASLGLPQQAGYEYAVDTINSAGGLDVGGETRKIELVTLDNGSNPQTASEQVRTLVNDDGAVAVLGGPTPDLAVPQSSSAELLEVPYLTTNNPLLAWQAGSAEGWTWSWNLYFDEAETVTAALQMAASLDSNGKVALFTDNSQDGVAQHDLYVELAPAAGLEVVADEQFTVGTENFADYVRSAVASGAELVFTQMIPPDGFALWREFAAQGYVPEYAVAGKAGASGGWPSGLGELANGTIALSTWAPTLGYPEADEIVDALGDEYTNTADLSLAVDGVTVVRVLADAMAAAGATDPTAINGALAETNGTYPTGPVAFIDNGAAIAPVLLQWNEGQAVQVYPSNGAIPLVTPVFGLE